MRALQLAMTPVEKVNIYGFSDEIIEFRKGVPVDQREGRVARRYGSTANRLVADNPLYENMRFQNCNERTTEAFNEVLLTAMLAGLSKEADKKLRLKFQNTSH